MSIDTFSTMVLADTDLIVAWAISIALTFLLIVVPVLYFAVLTLAMDDETFDRTVSDMEEHTKLKRRAQAYAAGKDVFGVLEQPRTPKQLGHRDAHAIPPRAAA
jgi:hypothetical protein